MSSAVLNYAADMRWGAIQPEKLNQYEAGIEHQFGTQQRVKLAYFYKQIRDQIDTGLLIPTTQIGVFSSVNLQRGKVTLTPGTTSGRFGVPVLAKSLKK